MSTEKASDFPSQNISCGTVKSVACNGKLIWSTPFVGKIGSINLIRNGNQY